MRLITLITFSLLILQFKAQNSYLLTISGDNYQHISKKKINKVKDSLGAVTFLRDLQIKAVSKGYILSSIDSIQFDTTHCNAHFFLGDSYRDMSLILRDPKIDRLKRQNRLKEKSLARIQLNPKEISNLLSSHLQESVNHGYPFAAVQLDSIHYVDDRVTATLSIQRGKNYKWTTIHIKGDSSISTQLISSLIGIKEGDVYNESLLRSISTNILQVNYLKEIKPFELLYTENGAELFLYLQSNPISSVNGIMGLQPNPITERLTVTGELNLKLLNVLHRGEQLQLNWRSIQAGTQSFNANFNYPFLFKSSFGIDGKFQLYKKDSTFLETRSGVGIQYFIGRGSYLKAFYQLHTSSILSTNQSLPSLSSVNNSSYGLSFQKQQTDYLPNPSKGYIFQIESAIGSRKADQGDTLDAIRSTTLRSGIQLHWFIPITKRNVIKLGGNFESYYAPQIYSNELYRFGGLTSLRGFNEDEILASTKAIASIEYRFLTDRNSHVFIFYDQAVYENTASSYQKDRPFGFGAGFSFGTPLGIFSISYAQGKQLGNDILLRNGKIHFGYIAFF
jgi:outer membrane protein assembly factor BamA